MERLWVMVTIGGAPCCYRMLEGWTRVTAGVDQTTLRIMCLSEMLKAWIQYELYSVDNNTHVYGSVDRVMRVSEMRK